MCTFYVITGNNDNNDFVGIGPNEVFLHSEKKAPLTYSRYKLQSTSECLSHTLSFAVVCSKYLTTYTLINTFTFLS